MEPEMTHTLDLHLEDGGEGQLTILLTISGTTGDDTMSYLANYTPNPAEREAIDWRYVRHFGS